MIGVPGKLPRELEVEPRSYPDRGARLATPKLATLALVTRHLLRGGARVALRVAAPPVALALATAVFLGPGFLESVRGILLPPEAGIGFGPAAVIVVLLALARLMHARLRSGDAFLRSLPISAADVHRGRILAAALGVAPLALLLAVLFAVGRPPAAPHDSPPDSPRQATQPRDVGLSVLGLLVAPVGVAIATAPAWPPRALSLTASAAGALGALWALSGHARGWLGGCALIAATLLLPARPRARLRHGGRSRAGDDDARGSGGSLLPFPWQRALRAVGVRRCATAYVAPLLCVAAALAFTRNNELSAATGAAAWRLGGGCAVAGLLATLAHELQRRRAPWAWSRSLPRSAFQRVTSDAALLCAAAGVALLPFVVAEPLVAVLTASAAPYLSVRAAAVAQTRDERFAGAVVTAFLLEGAVLAGASALVPWLAPATLLLVPFALRSASAADRAARVLRHSEIHASDRGAPSPS